MRVFVLGGTGFVGWPVVRRLHGNGHEVVAFHRGQTRADLPAAVRTILGDRRDLASYTGEVERVGPDVVIDLIPYTELEALELMRVFRSVVRRVVALSSGDVYRNYDGLRRVGAAAPD